MDERGLGKRLQEARQAAGLTQQQLCHKANLSFSTLTKIERGAIKAPSIFTVQAIAQAVGIDLNDLLGQTSPNAAARKLFKTKSGVSFIYFDVNGCLVQYYHRAFSKLAAATGATADEIETAYWQYNDDVCRGEMSVDDFNAKLAERIGVSEVDWRGYYLDAIVPITEMQELIKWTSERYRVGLLTNIMPGFLSAMRRIGKLPDINYDAVIDSSELAVIKPEAGIYHLAQDKAGVPPEEIMLIDDTRVNLMAAAKLSWHVMWFDDSRLDESVDNVRRALEPAEQQK